jgi:hypothetical protein
VGGALNFLAITKNQGKMPILTDNPYLQDYYDDNYFITASCEGINYCFAIDRFGGEYFGYLIMASVGDFICIVAFLGSIFCLIKWRLLVKKDANNLLPLVEKYREKDG